jgi:WD40 repeat protein
MKSRVLPIREDFNLIAGLKEMLGPSHHAEAKKGKSPSKVKEKVDKNSSAVKAPRIVYQGHSNAVIAVAFFSFPGYPTLVLSGSEDKTVSVWSLSLGVRLAQFSGHLQRVCALEAYADENFKPIAISGSWDESVRIWPLDRCVLATHETDTSAIEPRILKGHKNRVLSISVVKIENSPPLLCSGSADGFIVVWDLSSGAQLYRIFDSTQSSWIMAVKAFVHPRDGPMVASGGKDALLCLWRLIGPNTDSGESTPSLVITGHPSRIHDLAVHCNPGTTTPLVVSICRDLLIRIWSVDTGELLRTLKGHTNRISSIALCGPAGETPVIVSGSSNGNMRVWSVSTGEMLRVFRGHTEDVMAVNCIESPDKEGDVVVVSGSIDRTVRTWLFTEERFLRVLEHGPRVRINAMDILTTERNFIIFTGATDGTVRAWRMKYSGKDTLLWTKQVHSSRVRALKVYKPDEAMTHKFEVTEGQLDLNKPFVASAGKAQEIRFSCPFTGEDIGPVLKEHTNMVTSLFVFLVNEPIVPPPSESALSLPLADSAPTIPTPYLISGSEDNLVVVWSLRDGVALRVLAGHELDVVDVCVYTPPPPPPQTKRMRIRDDQTGPHSARSAHSSFSLLPGPAAVGPASPMIISGGMDNRVILWSFATGEMIDLLDDSSSQINSVAAMELPQGPILAAGNGSGAVLIWSLIAPYALLKTLVGHSDEVQCVTLFHPEGMSPILVSGSYDMTVRVWSLVNYSQLRTLEGHTSEITALCCFSPGGTDPVVASASADTTVRINIDFLGSTASEEYIQHCYRFDLNGVNAQVLSTDDVLAAHDPRWWRVSQVVTSEGPDDFFLNYSHLFLQSINDNRPDFVQTFLPLSPNAIIKTNNPDSDSGTLLQHAITKRDVKSVSAIVSCFIKLLTTPPHSPQDHFYDPHSRIATEDLFLLAQDYPREFEKFICAIKLMPTALNSLPVGAHYLVENSAGAIDLRTYRENQKDKEAAESGQVGSRKLLYLSLPINDLIRMDFLKALCDTCEELDSVAIFDSDVGQIALSYAWRLFGRKVHTFSMGVYFLYVLVASVSIYSFHQIKGGEHTWIVSLVLIALQLGLDLYFVYKEGGQFLMSPLEFLTDIWNLIDGGIIVTGLTGNLLRLSFWRDTQASRVMLSLTSILMWFNVLFYLRAFESTGPLVSMILRIAEDMKPLMMVVFLVLLGFSQAFWLLSSERLDHDGDPSTNPFSTIPSSLLNSFSFMLGGYDPLAFDSVPLESFALLLSCLYMLIVSILLLNLLIAMMGDSYGDVREKGLAQWRLEQCQLIIENAATMSEADRTRSDEIFFRKVDDETVEDPFAQQFIIEASLKHLQKRQDLLQSKIDKILDHVAPPE